MPKNNGNKQTNNKRELVFSKKSIYEWGGQYDTPIIMVKGSIQSGGGYDV